MSDPQQDGDDESAAAAAVNRLLSANTTLGIIAGLTLAAATENPVGDDDGDEAGLVAGAHAALAADTVTKTQRKGASVVTAGAGTVGVPPGASTPLKKPAGGSQTTGFSLQAPRETIQRLKEQNQLLKQELSIEARAARELLGQEKRTRVEQLRATTAGFARKLAKAQRQFARADAAMRRKTQELAALRQALQPVSSHEASAASAGDGGADTPGKPVATAAAAAAASGRVRVAENRLELALVRKNEVDSANKHLLARVDAARRDRAIFDGIYKKLERETAASRARHEQTRGELARATQARDALAREVARLQDAAEREQLEYERQFQELKRSIAHWRHETDALQASTSLSSAVASLSPSRLTSETLNASGNSSLGLGHSELLDTGSERAKEGRSGGGALSRVTALSSWKIGVDRALASGPDGLVAKYDQAFAAIRERTGLQDAAELAHELLARDAANFQRFKRVEELSREEVALQTQVAQLRGQLEAVRARDGLGNRAAYKQQCRRVEAALRETQQAEAELDAEHEQLDAVLTRVKASVYSVHNLLAHAAASGNSTPAGAPTLGRGATDANVLEYLQAIETYTTELLQSSTTETDEHSPLKARAHASHAGLPISTPTSLPVALPVGHGPPTLRSDPRQKLHVQVPSFGGIDGVIVLPAELTQHSSPVEAHRSTSATHTPKHRNSNSNSPTAAHSKQQQQMHRRRVSTRKSLSQHQFAAALASATANPIGSKVIGVDPQEENAEYGEQQHETEGAPGDGRRASGGEDEEEERALTYEELRKLAAKSIRRKRRSSTSHPRIPR